MKPWLNLTKKDMAHLKESKITSKKEFWAMREKQKEMVEKSTVEPKRSWDPCWECYCIEKKLNQVDYLFNLSQGQQFKFSEKGRTWTVERITPKFIWIRSENGADRYMTRRYNKNVIKVE